MISSVDSRYIANIDLTAKYKQEDTQHPPHHPHSEGETETQQLPQKYQNNILLENHYARYKDLFQKTVYIKHFFLNLKDYGNVIILYSI